MSLFELPDDAEILFEIKGNKIIDYGVECFSNGFIVHWTGSKGFGSFTYTDGGNLDTEFMGREFCWKFIREIFKRCEVEYNEGEEKA